jgi:putative membrane protein
MLLDAMLAALHYLAIILLVAFLAAEAVLCKPEYMSAATVRRLGVYDLLYFASAMVVLASGLARLVWGPWGAAYFANSIYFWAKVAAFALIALLSIAPTLAFMRWRRRLKFDASALPAADEVARARRWVMWEAHVLILPPVFAAMMGRGLGQLGS